MPYSNVRNLMLGPPLAEAGTRGRISALRIKTRCGYVGKRSYEAPSGAPNNVILGKHTFCTEIQTETSTARKHEHKTVSESNQLTQVEVYSSTTVRGF